MATATEAEDRLIDVIEAASSAALRTAGNDDQLRITTLHLRRARLAAETLALLRGQISVIGAEPEA